MNSAAQTNAAENDDVRPLCFGVVVWGEAFRRYFIDYLVASLLADGNFPEDIGRRKILLLCCPTEDWRFISTALTSLGCDRFIEVVWLDFTPDRTRHVESMCIAHCMCFRWAHERSAYLTMLSPDAIYSLGFVRYLGDAMRKGRTLVLCPAFRLDEAAFFRMLGLRAPSQARGDGLHSVAYSGRQLGSAAVASLHSEILVSNLDSFHFGTFPNNFHIRASDDTCFISKNLTWAAVLIDMAKCDERVFDSLETSPFDAQVLACMIPSTVPEEEVEFVWSSDAITIASWAPETWSARPLQPRIIQKLGWSKQLYNDLVGRRTLRRYLLNEQGIVTDWVKVRGLRSCVVFGHPEGDNKEIDTATRRLDDYLKRVGGDFIDGAPRTAYQRLLDQGNFVLTLIDAQIHYGVLARSYLEVIAAALSNNGDARQRVRRRASKILGFGLKE